MGESKPSYRLWDDPTAPRVHEGRIFVGGEMLDSWRAMTGSFVDWALYGLRATKALQDMGYTEADQVLPIALEF